MLLKIYPFLLCFLILSIAYCQQQEQEQEEEGVCPENCNHHGNCDIYKKKCVCYPKVFFFLKKSNEF